MMVPSTTRHGVLLHSGMPLLSCWQPVVETVGLQVMSRSCWLLSQRVKIPCFTIFSCPRELGRFDLFALAAIDYLSFSTVCVPDCAPLLLLSFYQVGTFVLVVFWFVVSTSLHGRIDCCVCFMWLSDWFRCLMWQWVRKLECKKFGCVDFPSFTPLDDMTLCRRRLTVSLFLCFCITMMAWWCSSHWQLTNWSLIQMFRRPSAYFRYV